MNAFVQQNSIVRKIWGASDTILFVFAGSAAEFALNKSVDWLYFTGKLPADPLGRLFSTVDYARRIVFATEADAHVAIDQITRIHQGIEKSRSATIPEEAYRDVLYMLIHYSILSFELLHRKLSNPEKEDVYNVFYRMGQRMQLKQLPDNYFSWLRDRNLHMEQNLVRSRFTNDLFLQYKKHLGPFRYRVLIESQKLIVPPRVRLLMDFNTINWLGPFLPLYRFLKANKMDQPVRSLLLPNAYRSRIDALDLP